jgi:hypothetical protein
LLFSGGSLESTGVEGVNVEKVRQLRKDIPMLSVLGCSVGNIILPGKLDMGKMIPICKETLHLIPEKYHGDGEIKSVWDYCQVEMNTRKDDRKDENLREFLNEEEMTKKENPTQMMYYVETIAAGTRFFWRVCLRDTSDVETGAFLRTLQTWSEQASQVGGNGRIGHGALKVDLIETKVVDSDAVFTSDEFVTYIGKYDEAKKDVTEYFEAGVNKKLFDKK